MSIKVDEKHKPTDNAVFVPRITSQSIIGSLDDPEMKHHNYYKVVLKDRIDAGYVVAFFRSKLGKLVMSSLCPDSGINQINPKDLKSALVALPSKKDQIQIVTTVRKLNDLKGHMEEFESELALNPTSSKMIMGQLDSMLGSLGKISAADEIRELARQGETRKAEFKETLGLDVKSQKAEKYLEESALKTIVGFLNSDGGDLLIGVADDGQIRGVNAEIDKLHKKNKDKYLLHFKNRFKDRIGGGILSVY